MKAVKLNMKNCLTRRMSRDSKVAAFAAFSMCLAASLLQAEPLGQVRNRVVAWGDMKYDIPVSGDLRTPVRSVLAQVAAGDFHSLVLKSDGAVVAWGDNAFGQTSVPFWVNQKSAAEIAAGNIHSLAL
ncbi:MAG TPA: RCC1 domain-containing protein, partial [Verrucomicrobiae bacterium]|nr:RCC1 domain-containing protein [Verrucomicrobiae bacterium]